MGRNRWLLALVAKAPAFIVSGRDQTAAACVLSREQTEGPYYVDRRLLRSDISEGKPGIPLHLRVTVLDGTRCVPLRNAAVDIWHCDALGVYSGYTKENPDGPPGFGPGGPGGRPGQRPPTADSSPGRPGPPSPGDFPGGPPPDRSWLAPPTGFGGSGRPGPGGPGPGPGFPPPPKHQPSDNKTFFRGVQLTSNDGIAEFQTIYPGWYFGRAIHIHMKVWTNGSSATGQYQGGHSCHTGQLFFPEDITNSVARLGPYGTHHTPRTLQPEDDIYTSQAGPDCIVKLTPTDKRSLAAGFLATAVVAVNRVLVLP